MQRQFKRMRPAEGKQAERHKGELRRSTVAGNSQVKYSLTDIGCPRFKPVILLPTLDGSHHSLEFHLKTLGNRIIRITIARVEPIASCTLDRALERLGDYDAIIFASQNAVEYFFSRARALRLRLKAPPRVFAVGPETARALRRKGWRARIPRSFHAEALANFMGNVKGWRILLPRAEKGREILPRTLRRRGARVDAVTVYRIVPQRFSLPAKPSADLIAFTFGSAVDHFLACLQAPARRRFFAQTAIASLGPSTTAALRRRGLRPDIEAPQATMTALAKAIIRWARNQSREA